MSDPWRYELSSTALRDLRRLDARLRQRVLTALDRYVADPAVGDVRKLVASDEWRLRVGDWRVRFLRDPDTKTLVVRRVLHRREAYREP